MKIKKRDVSHRRGIIGGSSMGAVLGLSPYKTEYEVYCEFMGIPNPEPSEETKKRFEMGHKLEGFIASLIEEEYGIKLCETEYAYVNDSNPWMICHPDRLVIKDNGEIDEDLAIECKSSSAYDSSRWGEPDTDEIPYDYLCQCYSYFMCHVCKKVVWLFRFSNNRLTRYIITRDEAREKVITKKVSEWVNKVKRGYVPQPSSSTEAARLFEPGEGDIEATEDIDMIVDEWNLKKAQIKELENKVDELKAKIIAYMGGKQRLMKGSVVLAKYTNVKSRRLDTKRLKAEEPDIYERYSKETTSTRLV